MMLHDQMLMNAYAHHNLLISVCVIVNNVLYFWKKVVGI